MSQEKKKAAKQQPKGDQSAATKPSPLEARMTRLEKQMGQLSTLFGGKGAIHVEGTCDRPGCNAQGEVVKTDSFKGRDYIHYKDRNNHSWFEERMKAES